MRFLVLTIISLSILNSCKARNQSKAGVKEEKGPKTETCIPPAQITDVMFHPDCTGPKAAYYDDCGNFYFKVEQAKKESSRGFFGRSWQCTSDKNGSPVIQFGEIIPVAMLAPYCSISYNIIASNNSGPPKTIATCDYTFNPTNERGKRIGKPVNLQIRDWRGYPIQDNQNQGNSGAGNRDF